jgi:hypothetical protein
MTPRTQTQKLPAAGSAREALREKGQFWTPDWIAEAMVSYCLLEGSDHLFDPSVGAGAFFRASHKLGYKSQWLGYELDAMALQQAQENGLSSQELAGVTLGDFVLQPSAQKYRAIVANPPYLRHHRIAAETKEKFKQLSKELIGESLDGRAGAHVYFLLRALQSLAPAGRLAFIMPADTCEGIFAHKLWRWITRTFQLEAVMTFAPSASPFPNVDTNPIIFLLRNDQPKTHFKWAQCLRPETDALRDWINTRWQSIAHQDLLVVEREIDEGVETGLSRPLSNQPASEFVLGDFAQVMRGIATGANEFFFLTKQQAKELRLPPSFLLRAVGRTRDVTDEYVTEATLQQLEESGRPSYLFAPDGRDLDAFPEAVQNYLLAGENAGLPLRPLIAQRRPWYKMETRKAPEFLFAYLGRRNARFIRNLADVLPLTGFLCVYPRINDTDFANNLWQVLQHPETVNNLSLVGKSYGSGAIKVEPRALERLPLPTKIVADARLSSAPVQMSLYPQ